MHIWKKCYIPRGFLSIDGEIQRLKQSEAVFGRIIWQRLLWLIYCHKRMMVKLISDRDDNIKNNLFVVRTGGYRGGYTRGGINATGVQGESKWVKGRGAGQRWAGQGDRGRGGSGANKPQGCPRCGTKEYHNDYDCPGKDNICWQCKKKGHITKKCYAKCSANGVNDDNEDKADYDNYEE